MKLPRLHKSSIVVAILAAVAVIVLEVPGRVLSGSISRTYKSLYHEHGWPWVYLHRQTFSVPAPAPLPAQEQGKFESLIHIGGGTVNNINVSTDLPNWSIPWLSAENWLFWQSNDREGQSHRAFAPLALIGDLAIAAGIPTILAAAWEFRRRRRPRALSFTLSDVLVAFAFFAAALGWWAYMRREFQREHQLAAQVDTNDSHGWITDGEESLAPLWLRSLLGERLIPDFFWRAKGAHVYDGDFDVNKSNAIVGEIDQFSYITDVSVSGDPKSKPFPFSVLRGITRLETLDLIGYSSIDEGSQFFSGALTERDADEIIQLKQLRTLLVVDKSEIPPSVLSRLQTALPDCKIVDLNDPD